MGERKNRKQIKFDKKLEKSSVGGRVGLGGGRNVKRGNILYRKPSLFFQISKSKNSKKIRLEKVTRGISNPPHLLMWSLEYYCANLRKVLLVVTENTIEVGTCFKGRGISQEKEGRSHLNYRPKKWEFFMGRGRGISHGERYL